jgi:tetratricopeptide (TPR) repeat protein
MSNQFFTWEDFQKSFGKEMVDADAVYAGMAKNGLKDFAYCNFDFHFQSKQKASLEKLSDFLEKHYKYQIEGIEKTGKLFELSGIAKDIPVTNDNLLYWALDMLKRGYEFDVKFEGYGATVDNDRQPEFIESKEDYYFNKGMEAYGDGNLSGAIFNWTIVAQINPKDPNAYYSRAIVKDDLYTWKAALRDYDKAIELAPDFLAAITNRGGLRDNNGDHEGAIADYDLVIQLAKDDDLEHKKQAYFNRGNSKYNLKDQAGACADWQQALDLGAEYAADRIKQYCK